MHCLLKALKKCRECHDFETSDIWIWRCTCRCILIVWMYLAKLYLTFKLTCMLKLNLNNWWCRVRIRKLFFFSSVLIYFMKSRLRHRPWADGGTIGTKARITIKTKALTLARVGTQGETESICATLWDAIWVVWLLALLCLLHLQWIQVAVHQLDMKTLEDTWIGNKSPFKRENNVFKKY